MGTLLSVFGGALLTALAALIGAWIQSRREHLKWVREQRINTYKVLVQKIAAYELAKTFTIDKDRQNAAWFDMQEHSLAVSLVGPPEVVKAVERLDFDGSDAQAMRGNLFAQMRIALDTGK